VPSAPPAFLPYFLNPSLQKAFYIAIYMRFIVFILFIISLSSHAQVSFKTVVPPQPVVKGESFQVQYIVEGAEKNVAVKPPPFTGFKLVAGPNVYGGSANTANGIKEIRNTVYTLLALRTGRLIIPPASIMINGKPLQSNAAMVDVVAAPVPTILPGGEQGSSPYFLQPGEDPYEKIKRNLFVKVSVNKNRCYTGEPVVATFNLYSRLQSKSDILKNPGFYGFTTYDMENLADKVSNEERINGQMFTVHTIRKVQLYPLQAGILTIDPMVIKNTVEFSEKGSDKKIEQEIAEGSSRKNMEDDLPAEGTKRVETEIETLPLTITVNPLPEKNKPVAYTGAVGRFQIAAEVGKEVIAMNEEGYFTLTISGKGNFIQTVAPAVQWPAGAEGFEPVVTDELDKTRIPLTGSRRFRFPFVCSKPGTYSIPAVRFSFFNTDSNQYQTIQSKPVVFTVSNERKKTGAEETNKTSIRDASEKSAKRALLIVAMLVAAVLIYWIISKKKPVKKLEEPPPPLPTVRELLEPAKAVAESDTKLFYTTLQNSLLSFAAHYFNTDSSTSTKDGLRGKMVLEGISPEPVNRFCWLLEQCEAILFTQTDLAFDKNEMMETAGNTLDEIASQKKI
jgi:hypothetical protein